jgi:hypothetical protein
MSGGGGLLDVPTESRVSALWHGLSDRLHQMVEALRRRS